MAREAVDSIAHEMRKEATHYILHETKIWHHRQIKDSSRYKLMYRNLAYFDYAASILRGMSLYEVSEYANISPNLMREKMKRILTWVRLYKKLSDLGKL